MALRPMPGCELKVLIATNTGAVPAENRFEDRGLNPPGQETASVRRRVPYLNRRFLRESSAIEMQPISFIPRSISARIKPRASSTPA